MTFHITAISAALIGLLYTWLSARVIARRMSARISVGDGEDKALIYRIRAQGNCGEYAPISLLLLLLVELSGTPTGVTIALATLIVLGRALHAFAFVKRPMSFLARRVGMIMTFAAISLASLGLLGHSLL
ncbi:hypothetical protein SAMN04488030_1877 [Aliiroseovarius halocynthiae]|uniref:Glutathione S-transferase n=1 Tax=Aliiroseovarius halocynthiae TaxID=985055 RepID=A0A545SR17_9RHOB|nr:MAPEG family protein [Aliiroseovarius halocynthiae]TQV67407.1 hypothetical protein FIL88_09250 [Aliiroseovarius halocynthiae]SMR81382.1 hypothetical protein SAMN04488030_1877 [Aliiroseovarius halocynthiae]